MPTFEYPVKMTTLSAIARAQVSADQRTQIAQVLTEIDQCRSAKAWIATGLLAAGMAATLLRARLRGMPEVAYQSRYAERDAKTHRETKIATWQLRALHEVAYALYLIDANPEAFALAHAYTVPGIADSAEPVEQRHAEAALGLLAAVVRDLSANKRSEIGAFRSNAG